MKENYLKFRHWCPIAKHMTPHEEIRLLPDDTFQSLFLLDNMGGFLLQYTGVKIKDTELYEGDIVEWFTKHPDGYPLDKTPQRHTKIIEIKNLLSGCFLFSTHDYKIIGNIYENPELL